MSACTITATSVADSGPSYSVPMPSCSLHNDVEPVQDPVASPAPVSIVTPESVVSATEFSTPLSTSEKCKGCTEKSRKCNTLKKNNSRLQRRVTELQQTIKELQSVSTEIK